MKHKLEYGKLIFLHGASSSGKTTIAKELQRNINEPFWHYSIDHFRDSGILPVERFKSGYFEWSDYRKEFFNGFHSSVRIFLQAGNNIILEHIIETKAWKKKLQELLKPFDVYFVAVHCELEELKRREKGRKDRPIGDAERDFLHIHDGMVYDLELDSTKESKSNAIQLLENWVYRNNSSLFFTDK